MGDKAHSHPDQEVTSRAPPNIPASTGEGPSSHPHRQRPMEREEGVAESIGPVPVQKPATSKTSRRTRHQKESKAQPKRRIQK